MAQHPSSSSLPDDVLTAEAEVCAHPYWDEVLQKPFNIMPFDVEFSKQRKVPLPNCFYIRRIKENFSWLYFDGDLRETTCAISGERITTTLPSKLDDRIISENAYLKTVVD